MTALMANIFLGCFIFGFAFTMITFLFGLDHHGGDIGSHHFHFGGDSGGHTDFGHQGGMDHGGGDRGGGHGADSHGFPFFSLQGIVIFLTFFGAAGYTINQHASGFVVIPLVGAVLAGFGGAGGLFLFMNKFLLKGETRMNPADYHMPGTIGHIASRIRPGGTGEIVYEQGGTRKTVGARSDELETGHKQGEEVVIVRYENGIAYVRSLAEELGDSTQNPT